MSNLTLLGEVEVPVKARMNCFPISITWIEASRDGYQRMKMNAHR